MFYLMTSISAILLAVSLLFLLPYIPSDEASPVFPSFRNMAISAMFFLLSRLFIAKRDYEEFGGMKSIASPCIEAVIFLVFVFVSTMAYSVVLK